MPLRTGLMTLAIMALGALGANADPFDPSSVPGLQVWYQPSGIVSTAGTVTGWNDSSSNANNATAIGTGATYVSGTPGVLNGNPYVQFDGTTYLQSINNVDNSLTGDPSATVFIVSAAGSGSGSPFSWGTVLAQDGAFSLYNNIASTNELSIQFAGSQANYFQAGSAPEGVFQVTEVQKSPGAINATTSAYVNGTALTSLGGQNSTPDIQADHFYIGSYGPGFGNLTGGVAEILVYNSALSTTDSNNVEQYLFDKYFGTPTPEPGSLVLMGLAAAVLGLVGWRKKGR